MKIYIYAILVFSYLGGISERFVPELLEKLQVSTVQEKQEKQNGDQAGAPKTI